MFTKIYEKIKDFIVENYKQLLVLLAIFLFFWIELPYVVYRPGGVINLSKRIEIENSYDYDGELNMSYVSMMKGNIPFILLSYVMPNWDLEKSETITYDGDSVSETLKKDKMQTESAMDNAVIASFKLTNHKLKITGYHNKIIYIVSDAKTTLKDYDEILSIEGTTVTNLEDMQKLVNTYKEGDILNIKVLRNKKETNATAKVFKVNDSLKIGVSIITTYDYETEPSVKIKTKSSESGPSGGLMMALSIYNSLTKEDITKGMKIAGTGTIDEYGNVGKIGGVKYKVLGAIKNDMDIFICPKDNYEESLEVLEKEKASLKIIKASTLEEAIKELKNL